MANIDFLSVAGLKRIATQGPPRASCYVTFDKSSAATTNHVLAHCSCGGNVLHFEDTAHNGRQQIDVWRYMIAMGKLVVAEVSIYDSYILTYNTKAEASLCILQIISHIHGRSCP